MHPRGISFVIPALNEERYIARCLASIPQHDDIEILVVDNGSTDRTVAIAEAMGARVVTCSIKGLAHARKAGCEAATYDVQCHIDADNELPDGWMELVTPIFDPTVSIISGPIVYHGQPSLVRWIGRVFYLGARLCSHLIGPTAQGGNFVVKRSMVERAGGWPTDVTFYGEDSLIAIKLSTVGRVLMIPSMWIWSSDRRVKGEGLFTMGLKYAINYVSMNLTGKPYHTTHTDFR